MDEDLFLATFMFGDAGATKIGKQLWEEKLHRMYEKNRGLRKRIAGNLHKIEIQTQSGLFVKHGMGVQLEHQRLNRVMAKIVRGLYYFEYDEALNAEVELVSHFVPSLEHMAPIEQVSPQLRTGSRRWPGVFEYRFNRVDEMPDSSIWLIRFYESHLFWCLTDGTHTIEEETHSAA